MDIKDIVADVFRLYEEVGDSQYIGEAVSKTEHSIQCAMLAEKDGASDQVILAAFLHDVGHLVGADQKLPDMITDNLNVGTRDHDVIGGNFLKDRRFPQFVCDIVAGHVKAKRYLVFKNKEYYDKLSDASKKTLVHQGGKMSSEEAAVFESSATFDDIIKMRRWDELAKDTTVQHEPLEKYRLMCENVLTKHLQSCV